MLRPGSKSHAFLCAELWNMEDHCMHFRCDWNAQVKVADLELINQMLIIGGELSAVAGSYDVEFSNADSRFKSYDRKREEI